MATEAQIARVLKTLEPESEMIELIVRTMPSFEDEREFFRKVWRRFVIENRDADERVIRALGWVPGWVSSDERAIIEYYENETAELPKLGTRKKKGR